MPGWLLWAVPALVAAGFALHVYHRREPSVEGRAFLAAARIGVLLLVFLLLWNPRIPGSSPRPDLPWLLLDASLSMTAAAPGDSTPWSRALERSGEGRWGGILAFGEGVMPVPHDSLAVLTPQGSASRVAEGLRHAAEAGARDVVVVTDGRISDPGRATELAAELGLAVRFEVVGGPVRNAGVELLELPGRVRADRSLEAGVRIFGEGGGAGDSVTVELREEGTLVATRRVPLPGPGRSIRLGVEIPPPGGEGARLYEARAVLDQDDFPPDDARAAWVDVGTSDRGLVLVSFRAGWEPRFLLPVLARVTGLEARGFLRLGSDRWLTLPAPGDDAEVVDEARVRAGVEGANVLVLHGVGAGTPAWLASAARNALRLVAFPVGQGGAGALGVATGGPLAGEWYPVRPLPPSPLAAEMAGLTLDGLPPLTDVLPLSDPAGEQGPLPVQRAGTGVREASLVLDEQGGKRRVLVLASGLWRWAFRGREGAEVYHRLWSGAAGWLLEGEPVASGPGVRPRDRMVERDARPAWVSPGEDEREMALTLSRRDTMVMDTTVAPVEGGFRTGRLPPGTYAYQATEPGAEEPLGEGRLHVEAFSPELMTREVDLDAVVGAGATGPSGRGGGRPLRTHPVPYLLTLLLLCGEWVGRRRRGLR